MDINTTWLSQTIGTPGTLASAVQPSDTTVTLSAALAGLTTGNSIVIDGEPMLVTAINGTVYTVTRGSTQGGVTIPFVTAAAHASGASVSVLRYPDPYSKAAREALLPWAQAIVNALGSKSATFSYTATGSVR